MDQPFDPIMQGVCNHLGPLWAATKSEEYTYWQVDGPAARLHIYPDCGRNGRKPGSKGRALISGAYPTHNGKDYFDQHLQATAPEYRRPHATVAYTRGPKAVAAAIRNLLPEYHLKMTPAVAWYERVSSRDARSKAHFEGIENAAEHLGIRTTARNHMNGMKLVEKRRLDLQLAGSRAVNGIVLINDYDGTISIKVSGLDFEQAMEAIHLINTALGTSA